MRQREWQFWVDRGGTFTDIIAKTPNGELLSFKFLSDNPHYYRDPIYFGIQKILKVYGKEQRITKKIAAVKVGTTIGTNALLERRGVPVLLAITKGFKDALRIGYQNRPDLFAKNIVLPDLIYQDVIEIDERVDAHGHVLTKINQNNTEMLLKEAYESGLRNIAIVLMHGYRYPQHESIVKKLALKVGFSHISVSHEVAPMMKLVSRGDTTVLDAYLSPLLNEYLNQLETDLDTVPLFIMQSNGRLAKAKHFKGKDSILSGPAGGVVGMVKTSLIAGFKKVIGFDMGGTSTDVAHFDGEYERTYSSEIAGVRLRTPMMLINTIAAGGGSILHFDGKKFSVGPDSAQANPGPACYRKQGPLTITDCNVLLGKIQADYFPKVFGESGQESIDVGSVQQQFDVLTQQIQTATNLNRSMYDVAEGFILIAVENMANAIKKISIERGYPTSDYVLNCFGAAAGQHACLVADVLGIKNILIHPLAGVLSAYGIGLANIGSVREVAVEKPLGRGINAHLINLFQKQTHSMRKELLQSKSIHLRIKLIKQVNLRYAGADTTLTVPFSSMLKMKQTFNKLHQQRFGFIDANKILIVESISIELIVPESGIKTPRHKRVSKKRKIIPHLKIVEVFTHGSFHQAKVFDRTALQGGDCIKGCAIIIEANATTIIEPGWQALVTHKKSLLLSRYQPLEKNKRLINKQNVDPIFLEIFNNRFMSIAEQMGEVLRNTASSVNIKERLDFSCALFDKKGELIANAPHIPVHLGSMSESVKSILMQNKKSLQPNDVFMLNAPYAGGTHLPDITVITPVFSSDKKTLLFFVASRGHHADIGGMAPGSMPANSKVIEEEGVVINNFKIVSGGKFLEKEIMQLLKDSIYPARNPLQNIADLKAQIAANLNGVNSLRALIDEFSWPLVEAYMRYVRENATSAVEELLLTLNDGEFHCQLDDGCIIKVRIVINKKVKRAKIDFTGTAKQHVGNFNAPSAISKAAILYVLRMLVAKNIPLNSGCFLPLDIIIPDESILHPRYPAAVVAGNVETSQCVVDTLLGALGVMAASQGTCNNFTFGNERYQYYETICGGAGAGPGFHGTAAVHTHMTNTRLTDPEVLEWRFPVLLEDFEIRRNSGGMGAYHGGDGVIREIRFLENMRANIISSHRKVAPYGLHGGKAGQVGKNWIKRANGVIENLDGCADFELSKGDVLVIETPGGGGYGKTRLF